MKLKKIIKQFEGKKILILGDIMLDKYIWGNVERISPEAPVPIVEVTRESESPGAGANVANNIYCLHGIPILVGVVGEDEAGDKLKEILHEKGMNTSGIFADPSRPTTTKTRLVVERPHQQIARVDKERRLPISEKLGNKIFDFVESVEDNCDAILFEDYDKGTLSSFLIKRVVNSFKDKIITADPKFDNFFEYEGVTLFKPNRREVERAMGIKLNSENIKFVLQKLRERLGCKSILLTLGEQGMVLFKERNEYKIPTKAREVYDETGAGDAVMAGVTMALACGASDRNAAIIANLAAGIEVSKFGAVPVAYEELLSAIGDEE